MMIKYYKNKIDHIKEILIENYVEFRLFPITFVNNKFMDFIHKVTYSERGSHKYAKCLR
jgi:hypothetical protein